MRITRPLGVVIAAGAVLQLSACGAVAVLLPAQERSGTAADPQALELAWSTPASLPTWLPEDARAIRWIASTAGGADTTPALLRVRSAEPLPDDCREDAEAHGPAIAAAWAPEVADRAVLRCGDWAVTAVDGGYYGWTPVEAPES